MSNFDLNNRDVNFCAPFAYFRDMKFLVGRIHNIVDYARGVHRGEVKIELPH